MADFLFDLRPTMREVMPEVGRRGEIAEIQKGPNLALGSNFHFSIFTPASGSPPAVDNGDTIIVRFRTPGDEAWLVHRLHVNLGSNNPAVDFVLKRVQLMGGLRGWRWIEYSTGWQDIGRVETPLSAPKSTRATPLAVDLYWLDKSEWERALIMADETVELQIEIGALSNPPKSFNILDIYLDLIRYPVGPDMIAWLKRLYPVGWREMLIGSFAERVGFPPPDAP